ncbi:hypothetical protein AL350_gp03 [Equine adenovirus 2]|uniref:E1A n=1 Tax=Equine adenovirus B serotype 2 TaxID=67603 RepID=A0A0K1DBU3_ADEE2|nr:hypothetical protein AL350_gp03 [Equine adenovirus 2]AKT26016.1 hypothetical protein [Equine adenovirus 2]
MKSIKLFLHPSVLLYADHLLASIAEEEEDEGFQGEEDVGCESTLHEMFDIDPVERDSYRQAVELVFPDCEVASCDQPSGDTVAAMDLQCHEVLDSGDEECDEVFCDCCFQQTSSSLGGSLKRCFCKGLLINLVF